MLKNTLVDTDKKIGLGFKIGLIVLSFVLIFSGIFFLLFPIFNNSESLVMIVEEDTVDNKNTKITEPDIVPGKFIIKFKDMGKLNTEVSAISTGIDSIDELNLIHDVKSVEQKIKKIEGVNNIGLDRIYTFFVDEREELLEIIKDYQSNKNIEYAEVIYQPTPLEVIPNDPYYSSYGGWGQEYLDQYWLHAINASDGWDYSDGYGVTIAYTDGIDKNHPDLQESVWLNKNEIPNNGLDDDNNGYIDDVHGPCQNILCGGSDLHGVAMAGVMSAKTNNSEGIASLAYGSKLLSLPSVYWDFDDNFVYAIDNGARILTHSWSGRSNSMEDMLEYAYDNGAMMITAAGNNSAYSTSIGMLPTAINVGNTDWTDGRYWSSGWGDTLDIMAPGTNILTTGLGGIVLDGYYSYLTGTSFSGPLSAALGALLISYEPNLSPGQLRYIIFNSVDDKGASGWDQYYGYGRINVKQAFALLDSFTAIEDVPSWDFESKITSPRWRGRVDYGDNLVIEGTATSPNFESYSIEVCKASSSSFYELNFHLEDCQEIISSNQEVVGGVLAEINTYDLLFLNDFIGGGNGNIFIILKINDSEIPYYKPYVTSVNIYLKGIVRQVDPDWVANIYENGVITTNPLFISVSNNSSVLNNSKGYLFFDITTDLLKNLKSKPIANPILEFDTSPYPITFYKISNPRIITAVDWDPIDKILLGSFMEIFFESAGYSVEKGENLFLLEAGEGEYFESANYFLDINNIGGDVFPNILIADQQLEEGSIFSQKENNELTLTIVPNLMDNIYEEGIVEDITGTLYVSKLGQLEEIIGTIFVERVFNDQHQYPNPDDIQFLEHDIVWIPKEEGEYTLRFVIDSPWDLDSSNNEFISNVQVICDNLKCKCTSDLNDGYCNYVMEMDCQTIYSPNYSLYCPADSMGRNGICCTPYNEMMQ